MAKLLDDDKDMRDMHLSARLTMLSELRNSLAGGSLKVGTKQVVLFCQGLCKCLRVCSLHVADDGHMQQGAPPGAA
jgi:hypothetical protein